LAIAHQPWFFHDGGKTAFYIEKQAEPYKQKKIGLHKRYNDEEGKKMVFPFRA